VSGEGVYRRGGSPYPLLRNALEQSHPPDQRNDMSPQKGLKGRADETKRRETSDYSGMGALASNAFH
jgi:hypothetical protein